MLEQVPEIKSFYDKVYASVKDKGDAVASSIAWNAVKNRLHEVNGRIVANTSDFEVPRLFCFALENKNELIVNASGDEITFEGILASTGFFQQGYKRARFSERALINIAEQINNVGGGAPDLDHEVLSQIAKQPGITKGLIMNAIGKAKGFIKSIQAVYENGKLWIRGVLDKSYADVINKVKGMSIEAWTDKMDDEVIDEATYLGFTFAVNKNPKDSLARVVTHT
jgi:hypothetical protein